MTRSKSTDPTWLPLFNHFFVLHCHDAPESSFVLDEPGLHVTVAVEEELHLPHDFRELAEHQADRPPGILRR
jgi:hypothetical protein